MFFSFAFCTFFKIFHVRLGKKSKSVSFSRVYVCVKAKLTLVSFFLLFFCTFPLRYFSIVSFIWAGQNIHIIYHCVPSLKGLREDMDKHLLANPFPEEGEGYRPV